MDIGNETVWRPCLTSQANSRDYAKEHKEKDNIIFKLILTDDPMRKLTKPSQQPKACSTDLCPNFLQYLEPVFVSHRHFAVSHGFKDSFLKDLMDLQPKLRPHKASPLSIKSSIFQVLTALLLTIFVLM
ncbi:hypothetical protein YC2023_065476 [Brassica napus]